MLLFDKKNLLDVTSDNLRPSAGPDLQIFRLVRSGPDTILLDPVPAPFQDRIQPFGKLYSMDYKVWLLLAISCTILKQIYEIFVTFFFESDPSVRVCIRNGLKV